MVEGPVLPEDESAVPRIAILTTPISTVCLRTPPDPALDWQGESGEIQPGTQRAGRESQVSGPPCPGDYVGREDRSNARGRGTGPECATAESRRFSWPGTRGTERIHVGVRHVANVRKNCAAPGETAQGLRANGAEPTEAQALAWVAWNRLCLVIGRFMLRPGRAWWREPARQESDTTAVKHSEKGERTMKRWTQWMAMAGLMAGLLASAGSAVAQDRGPRNFDPEQMRQRMLERAREQLEITNDSEWKAIEPLLTKVMEARRDAMMGRGFFGRGRGGPGGGPGGGPAFGQPMPELEALNRAIDSKASASELKAALAKYREARKAREQALQQAQEDLRKVLTVRQEAIAVANGWLD